MNILILINMDVLLRDCFLGAIKLTKNVDSDKYGYSSSGIGFDAHSKFLQPCSEQGENAVNIDVVNSLLVHADNRKKDVPLLGEGPATGLEDTT